MRAKVLKRSAITGPKRLITLLDKPTIENVRKQIQTLEPAQRMAIVETVNRIKQNPSERPEIMKGLLDWQRPIVGMILSHTGNRLLRPEDFVKQVSSYDKKGN